MKLSLSRETKEGFMFGTRLNRANKLITTASKDGKEWGCGHNVPTALRHARRAIIASRYGRTLGKSGIGLTKKQMQAKLRRVSA
jgi:hypothetical protein